MQPANAQQGIAGFRGAVCGKPVKQRVHTLLHTLSVAMRHTCKRFGQRRRAIQRAGLRQARQVLDEPARVRVLWRQVAASCTLPQPHLTLAIKLSARQ